MEKIKYDCIISSTTMFIVNDSIENTYSARTVSQTSELIQKLTQINSIDGLKKYIRDYPNALDNILCLLDISLEKFKRIISMIRINKRYTVQSEWDLRKTRNYMLEKEDFMNEVCELFLEGASAVKYQKLIPKFYLENFKINLNVLSRLTNEDDLKRLIKSKMETAYNNEIANYYYDVITSKLISIVKKHGYDCELKSFVKTLGREVGLVVKDNEKILVVIDISYMITTSSSQTDYARKIKATFDIQKAFDKNNDVNNFIYVVIIDGAGWIGRQSDLQRIHKSCNHFLNLRNIELFEGIITNLK